MKDHRVEFVGGLVLIALGIVFLLAQYFSFGPGLFFLIIALVFLIPYAMTRSYGFLIPGCILAGIGVGLLFGRGAIESAYAVPIGLGVGFIAIYAIQRVVAGAAHWWPLVPGAILIITGVAEAVPEFQGMVEKGWPVILIVVGLVVLIWAVGSTRPSAS